MIVKENLSLYLHIPFCLQKCLYCDFASQASTDTEIERYVDALTEEIAHWGQKASAYTVVTLYIGGGTPSILSPQRMRRIFETIFRHFDVSKACEITVECNPGTLTEEKLAAYRQWGVNRLSVGLQAWQDHHLKKIGRIHTQKQFLESYALARKLGFENINIDLIFGLPNQTVSEWQETLREVMALTPEHLSCYALIVEESTPFGKMSLNLPTEEEILQMHHETVSQLQKEDYFQYEISNFSQKGRACRHNLVYWELGAYIGMGAAAHSCFEGARFCHTGALEGYIKDPKAQEEVVVLTPKDIQNEFMLLGLRKTAGVSLEEYERRFGIPFAVERIQKYIDMNLIRMDKRQLRFTTQGMLLSNQMLMEFV